MKPVDWLSFLALALVLGVAGQLIRVAIGFKKMHDANVAEGKKTPFDRKKFWISIALGALAALVTSIVKWDGSELLKPSFLFTLMAAGYAGSDAIEGLISRWTTSVPSEPQKGEKVSETNGADLSPST